MEDFDKQVNNEFKPPYNLAFRTFLNLLHRLQQEPIPPRIDRTYLSKLSGTDQTHLMAALRSFALIDENNKVHPDLGKMGKDEEFRRQKLAQLLHTYYPKPVQMSKENATQGMLEEAFSEYGISGDSRRKAVTFYLKAAEYAGLPLSPHFKIPKDRAPRTSSRPVGQTGARKRTTGGGRRSPAANRGGSGGSREEAEVVTLRSGGSLTLQVDVPWLQLDKDDLDFVWGVVNQLRSYQSADEVEADDEEEGTEGGQI